MATKLKPFLMMSGRNLYGPYFGNHAGIPGLSRSVGAFRVLGGGLVHLTVGATVDVDGNVSNHNVTVAFSGDFNVSDFLIGVTITVGGVEEILTPPGIRTGNYVTYLFESPIIRVGDIVTFDLDNTSGAWTDASNGEPLGSQTILIDNRVAYIRLLQQPLWNPDGSIDYGGWYSDRASSSIVSDNLGNLREITESTISYKDARVARNFLNIRGVPSDNIQALDTLGEGWITVNATIDGPNTATITANNGYIRKSAILGGEKSVAGSIYSARARITTSVDCSVRIIISEGGTSDHGQYQSMTGGVEKDICIDDGDGQIIANSIADIRLYIGTNIPATITVHDISFNIINSNETNKGPHEYIPVVGGSSPPAGDGIRYYNTENNVTVAGTGYITDGVGALLDPQPMMYQIPASTNKCELFNLYPVDITGTVLGGDGSATLTLVDDSANYPVEFEQIGNRYVYKLDNSAGTGDAWAFCLGVTGNTEPHSASAWMRVEGSANSLIQISGTTNLSSVAPGGSYVRELQEGQVPAGADGQLEIVASAGSVCYFFAMQLEETSLATPIIKAKGAPTTRFIDQTNHPSATYFDETVGTCVIKIKPWIASTVFSQSMGMMSPNSAFGRFLYFNSGSSGKVSFRDSSGSSRTATHPWNKGDNILFAAVWGTNMQFAVKMGADEWNTPIAGSFSGGFLDDGTLRLFINQVMSVDVAAINVYGSQMTIDDAKAMAEAL